MELITLERLVELTAEALEPDGKIYTIKAGVNLGTFSKRGEMRQAHTLALLEALERGELVARSMHSRAPFKPWPPVAFDWYRDAKRYGVTLDDAEKFCELLAIAPVDFGATVTAGKKWTPQRRAELDSYRKAHGTEAAAEHFGISGARVRQLLPSERKKPAKPTGVSVFSHRIV